MNNPRLSFRDVERIVYRAVWVDRMRVCDAARAIGRRCFFSGHIRRIRAMHGEPPPCRCGKPGMHDGQCRATSAKSNPRCPECSGPTRKNGRRERSSEGAREQQYRCVECNRFFVKCPKTWTHLSDVEDRFTALVDAGEKLEYIAMVLGVSVSSAERWKRILKARRGGR